MKKTLAMLLVLVMVLSLGSVVAFADNSVTLNVVTSYGGDDGNRKNFENAVKAYEESTGNKVNDGSATSNEEGKAKVLTDFETGSEPNLSLWMDIVRRLRPRETMVYTIARETPMQGLRPYSEEEMRSLVKPLLDEGFRIRING